MMRVRGAFGPYRRRGIRLVVFLLAILVVVTGSVGGLEATGRGSRPRIVSAEGDHFEIGLGSSAGVAVGMTGMVVDPGFCDDEGRPLAVARFRITRVQRASAEGEVLELGADKISLK